MNGCIKMFLAGVAALIVAALAASAQTNITPSATSPRQGRVLAPDQPLNSDAINTTSTEQRPKLTERNALPPASQAWIEQFKLERRRYLAQQEALRKQLIGANDEQRARLRAQLESLRRQWLERLRDLRAQFKDRQAELVDKLPSHREVLQSVRDAARQSALDELRQQLQNQSTDGRDRRGTD